MNQKIGKSEEDPKARLPLLNTLWTRNKREPGEMARLAGNIVNEMPRNAPLHSQR